MLRAFGCLFLCVACSGEPSEAPDATPPPDDADARIAGGTAELGTGTMGFVLLVSDQDLGLVSGPQGGYHFIVHARIADMAPGDYTQAGLPENPATRFGVFKEDGTQIDLMYVWHIGYMPDETDPSKFVLPSARICQIETAEGPALIGQRVRMTLRVNDSEGRVATDERQVTVVPYEGG